MNAQNTAQALRDLGYETISTASGRVAIYDYAAGGWFAVSVADASLLLDGRDYSAWCADTSAEEITSFDQVN